MKLTLALISLVALACFQVSLVSQSLKPNLQRGPASLEKRVTAEERAERLKQEKELEEKAKLLYQLRGELAEIEAYNASIEQGFLELNMYNSSPLASVSENNEGIANYLKLVDQNKAYQYQDIQGLIQYGEMQDQSQALYYGLPMASRQEKSNETIYGQNFFSMDPLQASIIEIY